MPTIFDWDRDPTTAFQEFVRTPEFVATGDNGRLDVEVPLRISEASAATYQFMFNKFAKWMADQGLTMSTVSARALLQFLSMAGEGGEPDLNSKIGYRYLRLIERCYTYLQAFPNPARNAVFDGFRERQKDESMAALRPHEREAFVAALPEGRTWKRRRDRAMQLTMLFGGPRVSEIIGLLLTEVPGQPKPDGSLELLITPEAKNPTSYAHTTVVRKEGAGELLAWMQERRKLQISGSLVFPANSDGERLSKATVYRQVKATFERAGIDVARAGGRTLRNTFAVQELEAGTSPAELTEYLGLALERSTETYKHALEDLQ